MIEDSVICLRASPKLLNLLAQVVNRGLRVEDAITKGLSMLLGSETSAKGTSFFRLLGCSEESWSYRWPEGDTYVYEGWRCRALFKGQEYEVYVGRAREPLRRFNAERVWVVGFVRIGNLLYPVAEFVSTDDYEETRELISRIKGPNGRYLRIEQVREYPELQPLIDKIVAFNEKVRGTRIRHAALVVKENDVRDIVYYVILRHIWREEARLLRRSKAASHT